MENCLQSGTCPGGDRVRDRAAALAEANQWRVSLWSAVAVVLAVLALLYVFSEFTRTVHAGDSGPEARPASHSRDAGLSSI